MQPSWGRISVVVGAAAVAASASAFAAPAGATRADASTQVVDKTYSCLAKPRRLFFVGAQVRLPPGGQVPAGPAMATVSTANDHRFQVVFKDVKNSLKVDRSICRPSPRRLPLKPAGLSLDQTVTRNLVGHMTGKCPVRTKRVLVHFRVSLTGGIPTRASLAVRRDSAKGKPLAFLRWSPRKISDYLAESCTTF
jgi:hypothetical protein